MDHILTSQIFNLGLSLLAEKAVTEELAELVRRLPELELSEEAREKMRRSLEEKALSAAAYHVNTTGDYTSRMQKMVYDTYSRVLDDPATTTLLENAIKARFEALGVRIANSHMTTALGDPRIPDKLEVAVKVKRRKTA